MRNLSTFFDVLFIGLLPVSSESAFSVKRMSICNISGSRFTESNVRISSSRRAMRKAVFPTNLLGVLTVFRMSAVRVNSGKTMERRAGKSEAKRRVILWMQPFSSVELLSKNQPWGNCGGIKITSPSRKGSLSSPRIFVPSPHMTYDNSHSF